MLKHGIYLAFLNVNWFLILLFMVTGQQANPAAGGVQAGRLLTVFENVGQVWGDYDKNGRLHVYVTDTERPNTLFHHNGDGTFSPADGADQKTAVFNTLTHILIIANILAAAILLYLLLASPNPILPTLPETAHRLVLGALAGVAAFAILWWVVISPLRSQPTLDQLLAQAHVTAPQRLPHAAEAKVTLGRALFWDPLLGGNKDTACVTCHHPLFGTGDALALSIGTGGQGLSEKRFFFDPTRAVLVPRNATPIYNLALVGMDTLFWDGRVQVIGGKFLSPADSKLPLGLENAVAVQAMFPVTSRDEMRGHVGDPALFNAPNELAQIDDHELTAIWDGLMVRLLAVPAYQQLFAAAYPEIPLAELGFEHAANAIAAYQMETFTFLDSPWDRYLQGDTAALSDAALVGATLFFGEAGCLQCHNGPLLSDMAFHNIGVPQVGPGKGYESPYDFGRARETGNAGDLFAFRTPPLRNVELTGPWMHNGAYVTLEAAVRHHLNPVQAVAAYDFDQLSPLMQEMDSGETAVHSAPLNARSFTRPTSNLSDDEVAAILAFLQSLTSPSARDLSHIIPDSVPSKLPVGGALQ